MQERKTGYVMWLNVAWRKYRLMEDYRQPIIQPLFSSVNSVP